MATLDSFVERLLAERIVSVAGSSGSDASLWRVNASAEEVAAASGIPAEFAGSHLLVLDRPSQELVTVCVQFDKNNTPILTTESHLQIPDSTVADAYSVQQLVRQPKVGPHNCEICSAVFNTQEGLERHMCTHTGVFPFTCEICSRGFVRKYRLQKHMVVHSGERAFHCEICKKQFAQKNVLDRHMLVHGEKMQFKCPICEAVYSREDNLKRHVIKHSQGNADESHIEKYLDEMRFPQAGKTLYKCVVCGKVVLRRSDLRRHLAVHPEEVAAAKNAVSEECPGGIPAISQEVVQDTEDISKAAAITVLMEDFARPEKQGNVTYCEICLAGFCTLEGLQRHMCTHTGIFPFRCEYCGRGFVKKYRLLKHVVIHTGERPFQCDLCLKVFAQKNVLARHRLTHAEKTAFPCRICGGSFGRKDNLKKHMIIKHINQVRDLESSVEAYLNSMRFGNGAKPFYRCKLCVKEFRKRCNLRRHLSSHSTKASGPVGEQGNQEASPNILYEKCDICQEHFAEPSVFALHFKCIRGERPFARKCSFIKKGKPKSKQVRIAEKAKRNMKVKKMRVEEDKLSSTVEGSVIFTDPVDNTDIEGYPTSSVSHVAPSADQMIHIIVSDASVHELDFSKSVSDSLGSEDQKICYLLTDETAGEVTCESIDLSDHVGEVHIANGRSIAPNGPLNLLPDDHSQSSTLPSESDWSVQAVHENEVDIDGVYEAEFSKNVEHVALHLNIDDSADANSTSSACISQMHTNIDMPTADSSSIIYLSVSIPGKSP